MNENKKVVLIGGKILITQEKLNTMRAVDIRTVDKAALQDVSGFIFDISLSKEERAARVLRATKNPYCFRHGDTVIKLEFADNGPPLQDIMCNFLVRQKSG